MWEPYLEILFDFLKAFAVGGAICMIAQIVINYTDLTAGKILVLFMLFGVALQGLGLYQYLVDFAGAGATVPISGFGYLLANGAIKGAQKGFFGAFTGALSAASAGVSAAVIFSFIMAMLFKSKSKRN
nr:SpoVA/SpoVAEb family sporulation membrane protein [Clostridia bacterium]